jgi:hypothetical protein
VERLRLLAALAASFVVSATILSGAAGETARHKPRVIIIGDSVAGSLLEVPSAARYLRRRFDLHLDLQVCRRLEAPSCAYQGHQPSTAIEAARARRGRLGQTVVIDVGYNDDVAGYREGINHMMRLLLSDGVRMVIWTTLYENGSTEYHSIYVHNNKVIRQAAKRWPQLHVADWNAICRGRPWFGSDGLHLNAAGAWALAHLFRQTILAAGAHALRR